MRYNETFGEPYEGALPQMAQLDNFTRKELLRNGCPIYPYNGQTLDTLSQQYSINTSRASDRSYASPLPPSLPLTEMSVIPPIYLEDSYSLGIISQLALLKKYSLDFMKRLPGAKVVLPLPAEILTMGYSHHDLTGERLFDTRPVLTADILGHLHIAVVGFNPKKTSIVYDQQIPSNKADEQYMCWVAPLVVPAHVKVSGRLHS